MGKRIVVVDDGYMWLVVPCVTMPSQDGRHKTNSKDE